MSVCLRLYSLWQNIWKNPEQIRQKRLLNRKIRTIIQKIVILFENLLLTRKSFLFLGFSTASLDEKYWN